MSNSRDYELLLNEGKEQEENYEWIAAVEPYEKASAVALEREDFLEAAKFCERIGLCYHRAAMQAKNLQESKNLLLQSLSAYTRASGFFGKAKGPRMLVEMLDCEATSAYIKSLLTRDPASRRRLLDECCRLRKEALILHRKTGDRLSLGKTCNELSACLVDRLDLEWKKRARQRILREALDYGNEAIDILSELGEKHDLARAYYTASIHFRTAVDGLEPERKIEHAQKSLSYSEKAVRLSEKIGDHYLVGMSSIWAGSAIFDLTDRPDHAARYFETALECGRRVKDNYLIGRASYLLAHLMAWKMNAEEDPEKIREESRKCEEYCQDAIASFKAVSNDQEIARSYYWYAENYSIVAKSIGTSSKKKRSLLKKSVGTAEKGLEYAQCSGSVNAVWLILHPLSKSLFLLSTVETNVNTKKRLLEQALEYREENIKTLEQAMPYYFWNHGVYHNYRALIQADLAKIEGSKERKAKFLENAVESIEKCIESCLRAGTLSQWQYATLGRYYTDFGSILSQLYLMTGSNEILGKLLEVFEGAVETYQKADLPSRSAESYWQLAKAHDKLHSFAESTASFLAAHQQYLVAAKKIPSLKGFYLNHAYYMKGWSEIQKARHCHMRQEYGQAKKHYENAASLHKSSKPWKYLVSNYLAWAQLEHGEDLSRREQPEEARAIFQTAAGSFVEAGKSIEARLKGIETGEEREMAAELVTASNIRREYCLGRIALEEARILDKKGEYIASSGKYGIAEEKFQKAIEALESELDRREFRPIIYLCRAWQLMMRAEAEASPELYLEASRLFDEAKEHTFDEKARLLALGHSCFSKALEAGRRFEITRDEALHSAATQHLEGAAGFYFRAGFKSASEYAKATQCFFDAQMYMHKAKTEINPLQKAQYYQMCEKLLQASAGSYRRARKPEKSEDIQRLLKAVEEERELALSLTEVFQPPSVMSTTASFLTPTPKLEKAVGLERFEHANVQANLIVDAKEIKVGEDFSLEMQITNVGKGVVLLAEVEAILPRGFELVYKPDYCDFQDTCLSMKGKRLDPLKTERIRLVLRSFDKGSYQTNPRIICVDETGHQMISELKPVTIDISEVILPGRIAMGYRDLDGLLFGGVPENYSIILTSPSCDEKDLLVKNFLESGIRDGQITFLVTLGTSMVKTLAEKPPTSFYVFICNPRADIPTEGSPNVRQLKGVENLTEITIALTKALRTLDQSKKGPKRACIGVVSDVLLQHHAVQTRRWLSDLIPELRSKGFTTLAVMNPQMHPIEEVQAMLEIFDGEISIYEKATKNGLGKFLKIRKMVNQRYLDSELPLRKERLEL